MGLAASQHVFGHDDRDVAVDTTNSTVDACAVVIADVVAASGADTAFERLRRLRS